MGLFDNLISGAKNIISNIDQRNKNAISVLNQSFNPFYTGPKPTVNTDLVKGKIEQASLNALVQHPYTVAAVATTALSSVGRSAVGSIIKSLSPIQKVVGGTIAAVSIPTILSSPKVAAKTIEISSSIPQSIIGVGNDLGKAIENPSIKSFSNIISNNKIGSAVIAGTIGLASAPLAISAYSNFSNTKAVKENTAATLQNIQTPSFPLEIKKNDTPINIINQLPTTPLPLSSSPESISPSGRVTSKVGNKKKKKTIKRKKIIKRHGKAIRSKKRRRKTTIKHRRRISKRVRQKRRGSTK